MLKAVCENWTARRPIKYLSNGKNILPLLNYYNATNRRPSRYQLDQYLFTSIYGESKFPIHDGECSYKGAKRLQEIAFDRRKPVSVLDLYLWIGLEMGINENENFNSFLQPFDKKPRKQTSLDYHDYLTEMRLIRSETPSPKPSSISDLQDRLNFFATTSRSSEMKTGMVIRRHNDSRYKRTLVQQ